MDRANALVFEFGDFRLDTAERVLRRNGVVVSLTPKAVNMLELLVSREGTVVSRHELIEELWPDTYVEEANLTVTVSMLRKVLGDSYIKTIPKRGYAFAVPVRRVEPQLSNGNHASGPEPVAVTDPPAIIEPAQRSGRLFARLLVAVLVVGLSVGAWIAWTRISTKAGNTKASTGMTLTRLSDTGNIRDATISPDGNWLAFVPIQYGREGLQIRNLETGDQHQLLEPQAQLCWGLRFAHDGQSLYYNTTEANSTISVLYRIDARGEQPPHKIAVNVDSQIALSPDGSQIAFVRSFPGKHYDALVLANNDGTGERELSVLRHPEKFSFSGSAWSPDGKTIALGVSKDNGVRFSINAIPVFGGEPRAFTSEQWSDLRGLVWSDDGRNLIFSAGSREAPATQLWRLDTQSHALQRVTRDANYYDGVNLTKSGGKIVTMQVSEIINLWVVDPATGSAARKLTFGTKEGEGGVVSLPAGEVVYTVEENGKMNLWEVKQEGNNSIQLTDSGGSYPSVTPDGKYLIYASARSGVRHLYRFDLATHEEVQLTNGGGENFPSCSADGRWVVYTALAGARNTLWRVSLDGGPTQQLTQGSIIRKAVVSPDGKSLACVFRKDEADKWKIAILRFAEGKVGESLMVLNVPRPFNQILRWTPDSKALFYLADKNGAMNIWKQSLDGSPAEPVTQFSEDEIYYYDRAGTGKSFVVARGRFLRDIVLINNP
jgi:Tol biopolymer transport system component/DNA-binding winged helix-turn-helix (wHTH) protein